MAAQALDLNLEPPIYWDDIGERDGPANELKYDMMEYLLLRLEKLPKKRVLLALEMEDLDLHKVLLTPEMEVHLLMLL
ncbi:hypothetical protein E2562_012509 [Oryza meyeriana var. granulata]|uniref:Uncharacterized protein n=1 Tax=Oryza meyeriana var. granulata TaxID=110450 RepID=A0A6G1BV98_9ORYZ|nr:hypothetical protein E2562_012509 [Oryza meyeriana var. granulata]